ncbi:MAG: hypothetical protein PHC61_08880 [Chitinivibrionales bacterium]|nr:hypothetical protein [Chitinivibrionales bacterium]
MLEIDSVHEIAGTISLPPSPELFALTAMLAYISGRTFVVEPYPELAACGEFIPLLQTCCDFKNQDRRCLISARAADVASPLPFPRAETPYSDYSAGMLLGRGHVLTMSSPAGTMLDVWKIRCKSAGFALQVETAPLQTLVRLEKSEGAAFPSTVIDANDIHLLLGLFHGRSRAISMRTDNPWISPLRPILALMGYPLTSQSNTPRPPTDPIARRMLNWQQAAKKISDVNPGFTVSVDFSAPLPPEPLAVSLPGDEILGALFIGAKSLIQRGNLVIENMAAESWALQTLQFVRKMGCKIGEQVTGVTSFGQIGSLQLQRFEIQGRKADCLPLFQFREQLPVMVMIAAYGAGQSLFKQLELLQGELPGGIAQIHACLDIVGVRHGEMPDGIVIDGAKRYDGFDLPQPLPAFLAGAAAVAALKCTGKSTINDESILARWPNFKEMLAKVCKARV